MKMKDFGRPSGGALPLRFANAMNVKRSYRQQNVNKHLHDWQVLDTRKRRGQTSTETADVDVSPSGNNRHYTSPSGNMWHEIDCIWWISLSIQWLHIDLIIFCCVGTISCFVSRHFLCGTCALRTCLCLDRNIHWSESSCLDCFTQGVRMFFLKL